VVGEEEGGQAVSDTPRTDKVLYSVDVCDGEDVVNVEFARQLERELNRACEMYRKLDIHTLNLVDRIRRLEEALDLVIPHCSWVHHSKKHQHKCGEPCPVVALIEKAKEAKP
jgi:hypothetical protein